MTRARIFRITLVSDIFFFNVLCGLVKTPSDTTHQIV